MVESDEELKPKLTIKPVVFVKSSKKDLMKFPEEARHNVGFALTVAQHGGKSESAKALSGYGGASVVEIVEDFDGDTYRAVYTVKFPEAIFVLHAFQKKSKKGKATPKKELDKIDNRLKDAETLYNSMKTNGDL